MSWPCGSAPLEPRAASRRWAGMAAGEIENGVVSVVVAAGTDPTA
jgi:hypothetical protein